MPPISFPIKLWSAISSCPDDLLRWSDDGTDVLVNEERFEELIDHYPSLLRQPTLSSLRRLFAVYEFHYEDCEKTGWKRYSHPYFVRCEPDLLELFVLSHQTRRYNARRARPADTEDCKLRSKRGRHWSEEFTREPDRPHVVDSEDDLQPICSLSLFRFSLAAGLDIDGSAEQQFCHPQAEEEYSAPDCSIVNETEPPDVDAGEVSFSSHKTEQSSSETWMSQMSENEEWFGFNGQPVAVPVCCDFRQYESAQYSECRFANLQQVQLYDE